MACLSSIPTPDASSSSIASIISNLQRTLEQREDSFLSVRNEGQKRILQEEVLLNATESSASSIRSAVESLSIRHQEQAQKADLAAKDFEKEQSHLINKVKELTGQLKDAQQRKCALELDVLELTNKKSAVDDRDASLRLKLQQLKEIDDSVSSEAKQRISQVEQLKKQREEELEAAEKKKAEAIKSLNEEKERVRKARDLLERKRNEAKELLKQRQDKMNVLKGETLTVALSNLNRVKATISAARSRADNEASEAKLSVEKVHYRSKLYAELINKMREEIDDLLLVQKIKPRTAKKGEEGWKYKVEMEMMEENRAKGVAYLNELIANLNNGKKQGIDSEKKLLEEREQLKKLIEEKESKLLMNGGDSSILSSLKRVDAAAVLLKEKVMQMASTLSQIITISEPALTLEDICKDVMASVPTSKSLSDEVKELREKIWKQLMSNSPAAAGAATGLMDKPPMPTPEEVMQVLHEVMEEVKHRQNQKQKAAEAEQASKQIENEKVAEDKDNVDQPTKPAAGELDDDKSGENGMDEPKEAEPENGPAKTKEVQEAEAAVTAKVTAEAEKQEVQEREGEQEQSKKVFLMYGGYPLIQRENEYAGLVSMYDVEHVRKHSEMIELREKQKAEVKQYQQHHRRVPSFSAPAAAAHAASSPPISVSSSSSSLHQQHQQQHASSSIPSPVQQQPQPQSTPPHSSPNRPSMEVPVASEPPGANKDAIQHRAPRKSIFSAFGAPKRTASSGDSPPVGGSSAAASASAVASSFFSFAGSNKNSAPALKPDSSSAGQDNKTRVSQDVSRS